MERKQASDFPPEVLKLFDGYVHGWLSRREFLDGAGKFAVGGFTAVAMLESLRPNYAFAQQVAKDDGRITTEYVTYPSPQGSGTMRGYLARPAGRFGQAPGRRRHPREPRPQSVHRGRRAPAGARRVRRVRARRADAGRRLSRQRGKGGAALCALDPAKRTEDLVAAADYLKSRPDATGRIGVVGFCFGGAMANTFAVRMPDLAAAVPFYGGQPSAENTAKIKAPLLIHYAALDERINAGWPAYEAALKANGVKYEMFMYAGTNHGFHNDTTPRYDEAAAKLAWSRTVAFLKANLKS